MDCGILRKWKGIQECYIIIAVIICTMRLNKTAGLSGFNQPTGSVLYKLLPSNESSLSSSADSPSESLRLRYTSAVCYCLRIWCLPLFSPAVHSPPGELSSSKWRAASSYSLWVPKTSPLSIPLSKHKMWTPSLVCTSNQKRWSWKIHQTVKDFQMF